MTVEDRIRMTAHNKVRVVITRQKRSQHGFLIVGSDGTKSTLPSKRIALQFLLAIVRCAPLRSFELRPARRSS